MLRMSIITTRTTAYGKPDNLRERLSQLAHHLGPFVLIRPSERLKARQCRLGLFLLPQTI